MRFCVPFCGRFVERRETIHVLKIDVTASSNELFRDGFLPISCRTVERRLPMFRLKVDVTARSKELPYDGSVSLCAVAKWSGVFPISV
jgi:hypothetical protein